jgi:hypothetical protein
MRGFHASQVTEVQLQPLSKLCERPAILGSVACPLCTENQLDIQNGFLRFRSSSTVRRADTITLPEMSCGSKNH